MNLLIHNVLWVNPGDPLSETLLSIRIKDGLVVEFGPNLKPEKAEAELQADGQYCSPGWVDLKVNLGEPARPQNEGLENPKSGCGCRRIYRNFSAAECKSCYPDKGICSVL